MRDPATEYVCPEPVEMTSKLKNLHEDFHFGVVVAFSFQSYETIFECLNLPESH